MARDIFLKVDGIPGESVDDKHKGEIDVHSWSWGLSQSGTHASAVGMGGGAGKVNHQDITFTKQVDKSSSKLMLACCTGQHIKQADLAVRKAGGKQQEYLKIKFENVLVSSYQTGSAGDDVVTESISLNFAKVKIEYFAQDEKGNMKASGDAGYDFAANKKL